MQKPLHRTQPRSNLSLPVALLIARGDRGSPARSFRNRRTPLAPERHAARNAAHLDARAQHLGDIVRGGLALVRKVGRQNDFLDDAVGRSREQSIQPDVARADAVERRKPAHQHEVHPGIAERLLDCRKVGRRLHHAKQRRIAPRRPAQRANFFLGEVVASGAMTHVHAPDNACASCSAPARSCCRT